MHQGKYRAYMEERVSSKKYLAVIQFFRLLVLDRLNRRAI